MYFFKEYKKNPEINKVNQNDMNRSNVNQNDMNRSNVNQNDMNRSNMGQNDMNRSNMGQNDMNRSNVNQNDMNRRNPQNFNFNNEPPKMNKLYRPNNSILLNDNKNPFETIQNNINPYKVLDLHDNCDLDELKVAYRKLSLKHHPDKGGDVNLFNIINDAYRKINTRLTQIQPKNKIEHNDLKKMNKKQSYFPKMNAKQMSGKNFNSNKFNDVFDKNKVSNPYDKGYSDWKEDIKDENIPVSNSSSFNEVFNQSRTKNNYSKQLNKIDEPQAQILCDLQFQELGVDEVDSFSKTHGDSNNINFTDYRDAYTTESKLINPNEVIIDRPDSLNKLKNNREKISYQMNQQQNETEILNKQQYEQDEYNRTQRVSAFDEIANEHFNKVNQLMLGK